MGKLKYTSTGVTVQYELTITGSDSTSVNVKEKLDSLQSTLYTGEFYANACLTPGIYQYITSGRTGLDTTTDDNYSLLVMQTGANTIRQIAFGSKKSTNVYSRVCVNGNWDDSSSNVTFEKITPEDALPIYNGSYNANSDITVDKPGIYQSVTLGRPEGSLDGETFTCLNFGTGIQYLISNQYSGRAFVRNTTNSNSSYYQKIGNVNTINLNYANDIKSKLNYAENFNEIEAYITDKDGNYPAEGIITVTADNMELLQNTLVSNNDAVTAFKSNYQAYYQISGTWYSQTVSNYVVLPSSKTFTIGDKLKIYKKQITIADYVKQIIDLDNLDITSNLSTAEQLIWAGVKLTNGGASISDGECILNMINNGNIYSATTEPNDGGTTYQLLGTDTIEIFTYDVISNSSNNGSSIKYTIKNTLSNVTFSNTDTEIEYASEYTNTLTLADVSYQIKSISISMGGIDVTDTAWDDDTKTITISKVTGNIYITGVITNGYVITQTLPNCTSSNPATSVEENGSFTTTISANEGYNITSLYVTMGGSEITSTVYNDGVITINSVTADVVINVITTQITFTVSQGTSDGVVCTAASTIGYGDTLTITVSPMTGYEVRADRITVTEAGKTKTFSYADSKITITSVKGDIVYAIDAAATYSVTYTFNNVTSSSDTASITDQDTFTTTLSYDTDTFNGIDITVTMGGNDVTNSIYDIDTHTITITNPTGNIIIHGEAITTIEKNLSTKIDLMGLTWKFNKLRTVSTETFDTSMMASSYDDSSWTSVTLPYDWSIYNSFDTSTSGNEYESGWLSGGDAIYRCTVNIPSDYSGNKVYIHFDGVYMTSEVYVNGTSVGTNKNGYIPFAFDITDAVTFGADNTIAVAVSHRVPNSRWYSGAGIYRDCWITCNNVPEIGVEEVVVTTPNLATENGGTVTTNVKLTAENLTSSDISISEVNAYVYQEWDGVQVGTAQITNQTLTASTSSDFTVAVGVSNPTLWTTHDLSDTIRLYKTKVSIKYISNAKEYLVWSDEFIFGYRYISYDSTGFYLNGTKTFLKGFSNHHDNGPLGSESYADASERQLRILAECGCNCLRTTHAPQSSIFMDKAMRMGFMVIEELFDGWRYAKNSNTYDYARFFAADDSYIEVVVKNTIKRDINNPSVIMWSIGNEVQEGCSTSLNSQYVTDATTINNYVKTYDTTRPTTIGNNQPANTYAMQIMALVDIPGVNYGSDSEYSTLRSATSDGVSFSNKCIYGSETASPFYTRGIYEVSTTNYYYNCFDWSNSEQSNSHASWGDSSCVQLKRHMETYDWLAGTMPWTGFDYIGEPTPANSTGVRSSFFGIVDLCGLKKDAFYMYQAKWTTSPMIHIVPEDWTIWTEGSSVTVWVYSNCDTVKLHLNGVEQTATATPTSGSHYAYEYTVTYAKGTLVATGYDSSSNIVAQDVRYSVGTAVGGKLIADKTQVRKGGLIYVEGQIIDKYGSVVPRAALECKFTCTGGTILATDNGFPGCFEDMRNDTQTTFTGKCMCIVKADGTSSSVTITAVSTLNSAVTDTITVAQGDTNIYATETTTFMDPENPTIHSSVTSIALSSTSVHVENGYSDTVTITKTPSGSTDQITIVSVCDGFTAIADNTANTVTITNTVDDAKGTILIECGSIQKTINVSAGNAVQATCTMQIDGTDYSDSNNSLYVEEYMPVTFTATGSTVASVEVLTGTTVLSYDSTYGMIYGKAVGAGIITVTLASGDTFEFTINISTWTDDSSNTITETGIKSVSSSVYLPTISTYTTSSAISGNIKLIATDTSISTFIGIIDVPASVTISSTYLAEFGYDSTGTRKAYIVSFSGTAGSDIEYTLSITDSANGLHKINLRAGTSSHTYSYKVGTLSCTSITLNTDTINITSDATNNQKLIATVVPEDTTDDIEWTVANNYTTCIGGALFAIKNGTDTVTVSAGSQSASATINISGITEDETILAYNVEITGESQYYAGGSSGISWSSDYTLFAELKITDMSVSTANVISFGSNISSWSGSHYHIYYPCTTNSTSIGNFTDKTTSGICIAMSTSSPTTSGVTTTMKGGQEADTIYLVQNANGLWINGTEATSITNSSGSFATIQALTTVQIGSCEGSGRFTGVIKQLRCIKTSDLNSTYSTSGLTSTELEEISNNGFDPETYLAIYENAANAAEEASAGDGNTSLATPLTLTNIEAMATGDTAQVLIANPHVSNGYVIGYTTTTAGYSNSTVSTSSASGFANETTMTTQVNALLNDDTNSLSFIFTLTKTGTDTFTIALANGYGPTGDTGSVSWSTTLIEYTVSDLTSNALSSSTSMSSNYTETYCLRLANPSGYYLNSQGTPSSAKYATGLGEWSVWYVYKVNN